MGPNLEDVLGKLVIAIAGVLGNDRLRQFQPSEVATTFELGWHIREQFGAEWDVSGEYDRRGNFRKDLDHPGRPERKSTPWIRPDIIVHIIGERNNLLVVEAKLAGNDNYDVDDWKLRGMTDQAGAYGYAAGVHLGFDIGDRTVPHCQVYTDGAPNAGWTARLRERLPA